MTSIDIGMRIKFFRKKAGLSQEKLARKTAIERTTISKIESGKINITISTLQQLCDGFGVSIKDFFNYNIVD